MSKSQPSTSHPLTTKLTTKKRAPNDYEDPRLTKKQKGPTDDDDSGDGSSDPVSLPPELTATDICKANKVVVAEKAQDKALGASQDKVGAKPLAVPRGKGKERKSSPGASTSKTTKRKVVEVDDDDDDELIQFVSKKIQHIESTLSLSDETEPPPKKVPVKSMSKSASKSAPKKTKRKESPPPVKEEPAEWKKAKRPKLKIIPPPEPEEVKDDKEVEEVEAKGAEWETEEEFEPLPKSLLPKITCELGTGDSGCKQTNPKGGNGGSGAKSNQPAENQAGPSKKGTSAMTQLANEELVKLGQARAVGTIILKKKALKAAIPPSDHILRHH
ncbi:hypothetical protein FRC11_005861 [Ceratobasidium sp. 423]|nr:hypothetical protein FRC11_005861 [Ceratobasidium sp. 423]